jgi:AcrR family transcriptional regulator
MSVLSEQAFYSISVQDITEKAGVNRSTFYLHFPDKYSLVEYSLDELFRQEIEKRMLDACQFSLENLRLLVIMVCDFISRYISHCAQADPQFESLVEAQVRRQMQSLLQVWLEQVNPDRDLQMTATAASWAIYGLALEWSHQKKRPQAETFSDQVLPILAGILGITPSVGV